MKRVTIGTLCVLFAAMALPGCSDDITDPDPGKAGTWAVSAGHDADDLGLAAATDASGNTIVVGYYNDQAVFGPVVLTSAGFSDIFIAKYDAWGNVVWAKSAGGNRNDEGWGVATDAAGDVYVAGYFTGIATVGGATLTSQGSNDAFVAKYSAAGSFLWAVSGGGSGSDRAHAITIDSSGNPVIAGRFTNTAVLSGTNIASSGANDIFIAKYTAGGGDGWAKSAGGPGNDDAWGIASDGSGNVFFTGVFSDSAFFGSTKLTAGGGTDIVVASCASDGTFRWASSAGGSSDDTGLGIAADAAGNSYVTGGFFGTASFGATQLTSIGGDDIFIARYNGVGNVVWSRSGGGPGNDQGTAVAVDAAFNSVITGFYDRSATFDGETLNAAGGFDVPFVKYDLAGSVQWAASGGGSATEQGLGVAVDASGNVLGTGYFQDDATFVGSRLSAVNATDVFVLKAGPGGF